MKKIHLDVEAMDAGARIDKFLAEELSDISRSYIQKLIADGSVLVDSRAVRANYRLRESDFLDVMIPDAVPLEILPENIPLDIVYEDEDVILINKPKGMVVHPAAGHYSKTLVNALLWHCRNNLSGINGVLRPGIVHRIDKDTTGLIIACKNDFAHNSLALQLYEHSVNRVYQAICYHNFKEMEGTIDAPLARSRTDRKKRAVDRVYGKPAVTHYKVLENLKGFAHIECRLETGRTHQIRVHMSSINHALLGDELYCQLTPPFALEGQTLHAGVFGFVHPRSKKYMEFEAPLPSYFVNLLEKLRK